MTTQTPNPNDRRKRKSGRQRPEKVDTNSMMNRIGGLGVLVAGAIVLSPFAPSALADPPPPPPPGIPVGSNQVPWVPGMGGLPGDSGPPMPPGIPPSSAYPGGVPPPPPPGSSSPGDLGVPPPPPLGVPAYGAVPLAEPPAPRFADSPPPMFPPAAPAPSAPSSGYSTGGPMIIGGDSGPDYQIVGPGYVPGPNEMIIGGTPPSAPQPVGPYTPGGTVNVGGTPPSSPQLVGPDYVPGPNEVVIEPMRPSGVYTLPPDVAPPFLDAQQRILQDSIG